MALRDSDPVEVGGYLIEDRLGSGGMGVVYLARSASGRRLAVKVVHDQYADDDEFRTRFSRELAAARRVSGAFTAPVVDADADAPRPWMATLYIPGETLGARVRAQGPLPLPRLRELAAGLAEALRDIHRAGVVHRDLKPANVMLAEDGPRVIDFGISRATEFATADALTQTGRVMGTPPFMSPEQFSAPHDVGPAADVFSLGAILTFAATGRGPFDSPNPYETAVRVVEGTPDLQGAPTELLPVLHLCLQKHPHSRPTAHELLTHLHEGRVPRPRGAGSGGASAHAAGPGAGPAGRAAQGGGPGEAPAHPGREAARSAAAAADRASEGAGAGSVAFGSVRDGVGSAEVPADRASEGAVAFGSVRDGAGPAAPVDRASYAVGSEEAAAGPMREGHRPGAAPAGRVPQGARPGAATARSEWEASESGAVAPGPQWEAAGSDPAGARPWPETAGSGAVAPGSEREAAGPGAAGARSDWGASAGPARQRHGGPAAREGIDPSPYFAPDPQTVPAARPDGTRQAPRSSAGSAEQNAAEPTRRPLIRRLLLGWGAAAVALVAVAAGALALQGGGSGERTVVSELPTGWKPWHGKAKGREGTGASFERCAAVRTSLVCAGDDLMAAGWALADGRGHWSRPVDPTHGPDDGYSSMGALVGVHEGNVLAFGADDPPSDGDGTQQARYTVQSLDAATGRVVWRTVTGRGEWASAADPSSGFATAIPEGVIAVYGDRGDSYALLDADDGKVVWQRKLPETDTCELRTAAEEPYLLCRTDTDEATARTSVARLDRTTGKPLWTVEAKGDLGLLGQAGDRLVLAEQYAENQMTTLTLVDLSARAVTRTKLSPTPPATGVPHLVHGTVYFTLSSGSIRAYDPHTGKQRWENNSTVEHPGPPTVSGDRIYVASSTGRMAALNLRTGTVEGSRPGRDDATGSDFIATGSPLVLVDDALYVPYGPRSVYTVDVNDL
ncbi:PQQ-binding-like beta-propeller repeat protein [Streptomyces sp. NPDC096205]|uniref:protein kinase domain-containing protein n=1 Tax=Streptomyces sp. NPDC096205 TaxID=3366081 RepID=UPI0038175F01